ncbi:MAG: 2TM domain-containing protein, partial [bacterium]
MHTPSRASDQINPSAGPDNDSPRSLLPHDEILALRHVRKLKDLYLHAAQYAIVVTAMAIFNLWKQPQYWWFLWVAFGWGTGLVVHAIRVLDWGPFGSAWERA